MAVSSGSLLRTSAGKRNGHITVCSRFCHALDGDFGQHATVLAESPSTSLRVGEGRNEARAGRGAQVLVQVLLQVLLQILLLLPPQSIRRCSSALDESVRPLMFEHCWVSA